MFREFGLFHSQPNYVDVKLSSVPPTQQKTAEIGFFFPPLFLVPFASKKDRNMTAGGQAVLLNGLET
ncbi:hypothetical protein JOB18_002777 [Solea senegalensis]|uniref:Uncharacterized protein n=1 Tax=Solea senegalensis TaxID=28829 RepID=A0AAV6Q9G6_SOLSE|nr:hypothetical protein JOB18_002777 [Solea senegalensis]